ncbi:MAG: hypothetical protein ACR2ML_12800 [Solirubrobacteraceae bacterium]
MAALLAAGATAGVAVADRGGWDDPDRGGDRGGRGYSIGLWGDMPYNDVQKTIGVPNLITDMNGQRLAFTVNDGDLKAGSGPCSDSLYMDAKARFNTLKAPAVFTPGDNDWTDCDRNPGVSSLERLNFERSVLFNTPFSLGQKRMRQEVQGAPYVENRRWTVGRVTYATLNVQGSCNNLCDVAPDPSEFAARNAANIAWLKGTFDSAKARESAAVMVVFQANPGFDNSDATRAPTRDPKTLVENDTDPKTTAPFPDGFKDFLTELRNQTIAFRRPVVAVHGDSHYFRIDKPLLDASGQRLENFTRLETFGDHAENNNNDVQWVRVDVDPRSREVFSFQPQIVPANRTAVPAP